MPALQYVLHFPKGERYVSILKDAAEPEAQVKLDAQRARLKAVIKHQQAESAILTEADEGLGQAESSVSFLCCMFHVKTQCALEQDLLHLQSVAGSWQIRALPACLQAWSSLRALAD